MSSTELVWRPGSRIKGGSVGRLKRLTRTILTRAFLLAGAHNPLYLCKTRCQYFPMVECQKYLFSTCPKIYFS